MKKGLKCILGVIGALVAVFILEYILLIPVNLKFFPTAVVAVAVASIFLGILGYCFNRKKESKKAISGFFIMTLLPILIFVVYTVGNSPIIRPTTFRGMIGEVEEEDFKVEISPIDINNLPTVDEDLADNLGDKELGTKVALGSQVTLGEFTKQNVDGELYWVAPLLHSGFFKWINNREGTPGYVMVSAVNSKNVKLVDNINGEPIKIKYQPNAYFNSYLKRHIFMNGNFNECLTDFSFELDDNGKPYWVVTKYTNSIGFDGEKVLGVILVDAQSGEINEYGMDEIPEWIDRVVPMEFAKERIDWWGELIHGFFNFSKKDMLTTTEGMNLVYNDGKCYYYTGVTSVGADESIVGFVLTDTRTGEAVFNKVSGSTETAAMQSAEGKVQQMGYTATLPILINVENIPTYFMTLKDRKGLVKQYAMVSVEDYSIVATGESIAETKSNYVKNLKSKGDIKLDYTGQSKELKGTVERIGGFQIEGNTFYNFTVKEAKGKVFTVSSFISKELPVTKEGDRVSFTYNETSESIDLLEFDNEDV